MKVILLYVSSIDGKITKWGQKRIHLWTSPEDATYFRSTVEKKKLLVMGSSTFDTVHPQPEKGILRLVVTRNPETYKSYAVPGQLEFINSTPTKLVEKLTNEGYKEMLLVSGKTLSTEFLKKKLVDELWLTIEPKIFGNGDGMVHDEKLDIQLKVVTVQKLNANGTLLVKYKIER